MLLGTCLTAVVASAALLSAEKAQRPRVLGLSHVSFRVSDLARARSFYEGFLGYGTSPVPEAGRLPQRAILVVNERQYVELRSGLRPEEDRLDHVALETDDAEAMRLHLASRGIRVPGRIAEDPDGNHGFTVDDPEGHSLEFVQHRRGGWPRRAGPPGPGPISRRVLHAGILVGDLVAATRFYGDALGFTETWRGSSSGVELSWTNMKVPDGGDYLEFMLHGERPVPDARGTQHHLCLEVPDVEEARGLLRARPYLAGYRRPLEVRVGRNRRRQLNLFDPDGTRVELMEPDTVDGQPAPPSTAPPPRRLTGRQDGDRGPRGTAPETP